ncbi:hypothetical protein [Rubrivivax rivuli]|uniref:Lipoprotein n=1 Tax=Rubrivivax rivuli TaxID=1862385 RepID=A0A437RE91_9BURK|nr:hypothetical protein [Rubrivivax rivuli]RVU45080.1 hypothetical protein EOE66_13040 [Rubrivivax rivuli]
MKCPRLGLRSAGLGAVAAGLLLAACGGGGGDGGGSGGSTQPLVTPSSGTYAWVLRAEGRTDALRYALSLVHPQDSATEVPIEAASASVTDARLVATGTVDGATQQSGALEPHALVYIVGGDVRRVPLRANGQPPLSRVSRAGTSSACRFVIDAVDHANPERSRFIVATAGADGQCGTADDGRGELRLDATLGLVFAPLGTDAPLAVLRDGATLAPAAWLLPTQVQPWAAAAGAVSFRSANQPVQRVLQAAPRTLLVESANGVSVVEVGADLRVTETAIPSMASTGWQGVGHDATHFFAFRNGGTEASPNWTLQRVSRSAPSATTLATASGQVTLASMGQDVLYATVLGSSTVQTLRLPKAVPNAFTTLDSGNPSAQFTTVITGGADVHLLWRVTGLNTGSPVYTVQMVNESGTALYTGTGGFSLGLADAGRVDFRRSESRSRFLFAENYGSRLFGDATLVVYDSAMRSATRVGQLPGNAEFGVDLVFANALAGPTAAAGGFAARSISGVVQASNARIFSFDPAVANSLRYTSRQP